MQLQSKCKSHVFNFLSITFKIYFGFTNYRVKLAYRTIRDLVGVHQTQPSYYFVICVPQKKRKWLQDGMAGPVFHHQTSTICRDSCGLTNICIPAKYRFKITKSHYIWNFLYVETSADLWITDPYHNRFDLIQCDDMTRNSSFIKIF